MATNKRKLESLQNFLQKEENIRLIEGGAQDLFWNSTGSIATYVDGIRLGEDGGLDYMLIGG